MEKQKGGENLNLKVVLLLFLTIFVSTVTTVAMVLSVPTPCVFSATKTAPLNIGFGGFQPNGGGEEVDNPVAPA